MAKLWSAADIGEYLGLSTRHVADRVVVMPTFPRAIRIPTTQGKSQPRWKPAEVEAYAEQHQERA